MNANEMTFGIEVECFLPADVIRDQRIIVGSYHGGIQVPGLPQGWKAQSDCSLHSSKRGYVAVEISSPVLRGREGIESVVAAFTQLKEWRFHVNPTCGLHVHVGADFANNLKALINLVFLASKFERALFAITGTKSREHARYAAPMSQIYDRIRGAKSWDVVRQSCNKYLSLNLCHLFGNYRTVEFRVFQGTTSLSKVLAYIQVCLALCEHAHHCKRRPTAACKNYRHQTGGGLLYRMLRNFNWNSEKRMGDTRFGLLTPERLEELKGELRRLASKYDKDDSREQHFALRPVVEPRR